MKYAMDPYTMGNATMDPCARGCWCWCWCCSDEDENMSSVDDDDEEEEEDDENERESLRNASISSTKVA
jgi:hypothetical protein